MASEGVRILAALASLGWRLPDGRPERFLVGEEPQPVILLADLSGIQPIEGERSVELHRTAAFGWARDVASACPEGLPDRASRAIFRRRGDVRGLLRSLSLSL